MKEKKKSVLPSCLSRLHWRSGTGYSIVVYILLIDLAFVFLYPYIYMLSTSFKSYNDTMSSFVKWIPKEFSPENWKVAFELLQYPRRFFNSALVSILSTLGHLLSCSFVAYGFARYQFPLKKMWFVMVLLTIAVPVQSIIIPQYRIYSILGITGGYLPLLLPTLFGFGLRGGLFVFLFRQNYLRLPAALEEAAEIDGSNPLMTYFRIVLPSSGSITLVCFVLSMVWHWNDYYEPSIYLTNSDLFLLPQALPAMTTVLKALQESQQADSSLQMTYHSGVSMAGTAMAVLPLLIMFLFLQKRFVEGIERTGLVE